MMTLILGGQRSGKSRYAEQVAARLAESHGFPVTYLATAWVQDAEMAERVRLHRERRPLHWQTIEAGSSDPRALARAVAAAQGLVLLDCASLWVAACTEAFTTLDERAAVQAYKEQLESLREALLCQRAPVVVVSAEVGLGLVPLSLSGRRFSDWLGWLNQELAKAAETVCLVVAGQPILVKGEALPCPPVF